MNHDKFLLVNGNDLQGNACPLPTYNAYPCPVICVRNVDQCPQTLKPAACPEGQSYCVDGQCHSGGCPSDLLSFCACYGAPAIEGDMYPCSQDQVVTIPNFNAANKTAQSLEACQANATLSVGDWAANATAPVWNTCPVADTPAGPPDFTSPFFLAMWVFYASLPVLNVLWYFYKLAREKVNTMHFIVFLLLVFQPLFVCDKGVFELVMCLPSIQGFNRLIWRGDKFLLCRIPYLEMVYCIGCTQLIIFFPKFIII
jgi:hypothetical protein